MLHLLLISLDSISKKVLKRSTHGDEDCFLNIVCGLNTYLKFIILNALNQDFSVISEPGTTDPLIIQAAIKYISFFCNIIIPLKYK